MQQQLKDRGHTFRTRSDSEVIAHAYEEWGADCVTRFQGMFALAVWDGRGARQSAISNQQSATVRSLGEDGTLFLARDRLGIKPLYYTAISGFVFASEVRTLLASGVVPRKLSRAAVESYLLFGSVSEPMTLVEGIYSLPPGHHMTVAVGAPPGSLNVQRYWNIAKSGRGDAETRRTGDGQSGNGNSSTGHSSKADSTHAAKRVRNLLEQSVRSHLIADVPVGVFLSSGIDSTALAALASREVSGVHTFTVAFPEDKFSEATIARRTAERLGTTHSEVMLSGDETLARLGAAVGALDLPTMDGINTYFVSASARAAGLKVALSGLGGDEVFGGYKTFSRTPHYQRVAQAGKLVPAGLKSAMAAALAEAGGRFLPGDAARKIAALWKDANSLPDPYYFGRLLFTPAQVATLMNGARSNPPATTTPTGLPGWGPRSAGGTDKMFRGSGRESLWWGWLAESSLLARQLDSFAAVSCLEAQSYLVNTLLRDTDSMSMAHSLEVRVPFLDHPLVEFVTHLPEQVKLSRGTPKALLVAALEDVLPAEVVHQAKRGFTFPWEAWLRGPMRESVEAGLSSIAPALAEALDGKQAYAIWQSYLNGKTTWSRPWSLFVLNEWVKKHL